MPDYVCEKNLSSLRLNKLNGSEIFNQYTIEVHISFHF